jgi:flagellar basal-body rod protein FlgB
MEGNRIPLTGSTTAEDDWKSRALIFRGQRQGMLASNIANADTPGHKARDASFAQALEQVSTGPLALKTTSASHAGGSTLGMSRSTLDFASYVQPVQPRLDGNTVEPDRERAAFASNSILYQFALSLVDDELKEFKMAASDPRR